METDVRLDPTGHRFGWADGNTSPTRKRGVETIPRLRFGLVLEPFVQLLVAISSGQRLAVQPLWGAGTRGSGHFRTRKQGYGGRAPT